MLESLEYKDLKCLRLPSNVRIAKKPKSVADLYSKILDAHLPLRIKILSIVLGKFGKVACWRPPNPPTPPPPPLDWCPHLGEILDPPLRVLD